MPINLRAPELTELKPRITVLGVGGAGGNAVNNMINAKLEGVSFVVANTDAQALAQSRAERKIQLGARVTEGLGAGAKPDVGRAAAEETLEEILEHLAGAHMVFITAGMGGGTGTGAAPVIARAVRELGVLTVGVVTKPFHFEGDRRMKLADRGIEELQNYVDTLIVIPNQNLFRVANERTTFAQAFAMADEVLHSGVRGITDLIVMPGLINRDFADIKTVMSEMGKAMMGTGETDGENRALRAAEAAISNPLLDEVSMKGARAVLVNVTGGPDMMLFEVDEAVNRIRAEVESDANILFGSALSETMEGRIRVSVVATGIDAEAFSATGSDNVKLLHPAQGRAPVKPPASIPTPAELAARTIANSVHVRIDAAQQRLQDPFEAIRNVHDAVVARDASAIRPEESVMDLGGDDAPVMETEDLPVIRHEPAPVPPQPPQPQRRRFAGLFGGRRREEKQEPVMDSPRASATAQTIGMRTKATAQPATKVSVTKQSPVMPGQAPSQEHKSRLDGDLFGEAGEDKRASIPAFLRAQDKSEAAENERFEIPAFLRKQAGNGN